MILFFSIAATYIGLLVLIKPAPESLKEKPLDFVQNLKLIWASLLSGFLILGIYQLTTNLSFLKVDETIYYHYALNNNWEINNLWLLQVFTNNFIHANPVHVLSNLSGLGLASLYERRVGAIRYFTILFVGSFSSIPSILFYSNHISVCGISGGVFGLFAAYFTDINDLPFKDWLIAIALFIFIAVFITIYGLSKSHTNENLDFQIDYIGHILGALGAIIYCRLFPVKSLNIN